jgi:hypothetical protein
VADHTEELGIRIKADGTVELSNGMKLSAEQTSNLGKELDKLGQKMADTDKGGKAVAASSREMGKELATAGQNALQAGRAAADGRWGDAAANVGELAMSSRGMSAAMLVGGGVVGSLVVGVGALAYAAIKGSAEERKLNDQLILTGNYAGLVTGQLDQMAQSVATGINGKVGAARDVLAGLAGTGRFTAESMHQVAEAAQLVGRFSGQSSEQVVRHFAGMADGVTKWAADTNKSYHFLNLETYQYIKTLEEQGRTQDAIRVASQALSSHLGGDLTTNLGYAEQAWAALGRTMSKALEGWKSIGKEDGPEARVRAAGVAVDQARLNLSGNYGGTPAERQAALSAAISTFNKEMDTWIAAQRAATGKSEKAQAEEAKIASDKEWERIKARNRTRQQLTDDELKEARKHAERLGGKALDDLPGVEAEIRARRADKGGRADNSAERELEAQRRLMTELAGLNSSFAQDWERLSTLYRAGKYDIEGLTEAQGALLAKQPAVRAAAQEEAATLREVTQERDRRLKLADQQIAATAKELDGIAKTNEGLADQISRVGLSTEALANLNAERLNGLITTARAELAYGLEHDYDQRQAKDKQKLIDLLEKQRDLTLGLASKQGDEERKKKQTDESKQFSDDLRRDLTDGLMRGFESGKDPIKNLGDTLYNVIRTRVTRALAEAIANPILGPLEAALKGQGGFGGILSKFFPGGGGMTGMGQVNHVSGEFMGSLEFAGGGVMTPRGSLPLHRYSTGGVANSPQVAIYGEGRQNEAYVPLPDGRSIPVTMAGGGTGTQITYAPQIQIDARTDQAEVYELVSRAVRAGQADLLDQLDRRTI